MPARTILGQPGGPVTSSAQTFTGDVFFKSGRPVFDVRAFGAAGDNATDDTAAFQAAHDAATASGIVYVPNGSTSANTYLIKTGPVNITTTGVTVVAGSLGGVTLSAGTADSAIFNLNGVRVSIRDLDIIGSATINATKDAVTIGTSAVNPLIDHCLISGGRLCVNDLGAADPLVMRSVINSSYGQAVINAVGGYYQRCKIDQPWPVATPAASNLKGAWASATAYSLNDVVSTGGYNIQCSVAGTSGSSAPTLQTYGVAITDNTVTWKLVGQTTYYGMKINTTSFIDITDADVTGNYTTGIVSENSTSVLIRDTVVGACINEGIKLWGVAGGTTGQSIGTRIVGGQISNIVSSTGKAIWLYSNTPQQTREVNIEGVLIFNSPYGVYGSGVTTNANWTIGPGNRISNATVEAVHIDGGVDHFKIIGNDLGKSIQWGVNVVGIRLASGATDFFVIEGNMLDGATTAITNNVTTSTRGSIVNNPGYNPQAASTITAGASPWTYTNNDAYPELLNCNANFGNITALTWAGQSIAVAGGTNTYLLAPGQTLVVTWTTTAPVFVKVPQ